MNSVAQSRPAIRAEGLSKRFTTDLAEARRLAVRSITRELFGRAAVTRPDLDAGEFWALDDVSFSVHRGEALGVVGNNGAGKTTLLRILSGIITPDWGSVTISGRTTSLIEPSTAFDAWSTGREAIWYEGAVLGLTADRISEIEDQIVEFAGLTDVIDAPIRTYSTGMRMRLGYAVAAHTNPDVMLVDEVLAVGDTAFQRKCISFILEFLEAGGALVLVSHSMWQIRSVCSRSLVLDRGRVVAAGDTAEALKFYLERSLGGAEFGGSNEPEQQVARSSSGITIDSITVCGRGGCKPKSGSSATLEVEVTVAEGCGQPVCCVTEIGLLDMPVTAVSLESKVDDFLLQSGRNRIRCEIDQFDLVASIYQVSTRLFTPCGEVLAEAGFEDPPLTIRIEDPDDRDHSPHRLGGVFGTLRIEETKS